MIRCGLFCIPAGVIHEYIVTATDYITGHDTIIIECTWFAFCKCRRFRLTDYLCRIRGTYIDVQSITLAGFISCGIENPNAVTHLKCGWDLCMGSYPVLAPRIKNVAEF